MAEKTRNLGVKGILWSKSKVCLDTGKKIIHVPPAHFTDLWGKQTCKAVKYIDLWCLKGEQLLTNVGEAPS